MLHNEINIFSYNGDTLDAPEGGSGGGPMSDLPHNTRIAVTARRYDRRYPRTLIVSFRWHSFPLR